MASLHVLEHPLIQHKLSLMRNKNTGSKEFRELLEEIAMLMAYEVTRDFPLKEIEVETPICVMKTKVLAGRKVGVVPILRAGLGMVDGILNLIPAARVGHVGLYRDPETLEPVEYYCKLPNDVQERELIVIDPMLATGGSASAAITFLKQRGCSHIKLVCLIAAPEGVARGSQGASGRGHLRGRHGRVPERPRLYRAGPGRRGRPVVWNQITNGRNNAWSLEVLKDIEKAEARAENILAEAQRESREMVKAAEEASLAQSLSAAQEHRALAQRILEDAQATVRKRIDALNEADARSREQVCGQARKKLDAAAQRIFERIVSDGNR